MLTDCPECDHRVSDRAAACPQCGFPIAESVSAAREQEARDADKASRAAAGEVDCPSCDARGFTTTADDDDRPTSFSWCTQCESSGRRPLVKSEKGFWAVSYAVLDNFLAGDDYDAPAVTFLGETAPSGFRYPQAGARKKTES